MKNTILVFSFLTGMVKSVLAQQLPNQNFEQWDTIGDYVQPTSWYSLNPLTLIGLEAGTTIDTQPYNGAFAVRLETKSNGMFAVPGLLSTGPVLKPNLEPDFTEIRIPFAYKPDSVVCYVKGNPEPNDSGVIAVQFTHWNEALSKVDTLGGGAIYIQDEIASFTRMSFPIEYDLPFQPDSMFMIATSSASRTNPVIGSWLVIDGIEFIYNQTTSVKAPQQTKDLVTVFPNPCNTQLHFKFQNNQTHTFCIVNSLGQLVGQFDGTTQLDIQYLQSGMYTVMFEDGSSTRFLIQH